MKLLLALAATALISSACAASAEVIDFHYEAWGGPSGYDFGSGQITLGQEDDGKQQVLSITGRANGSKITGLTDYAGADEIVYDKSLFLDQGGISFATAAGIDYNLFSYDGRLEILKSTAPHDLWASSASRVRRLCIEPVATPVSAAPEPASWLLMFAGIGGIGLAFRQARRNHGFQFKDALSA